MVRAAIIGLALAVAPAPAWANSGVGYLMLAMPAMVLALAPVILVETPVLCAILRLPLWPGLKLSTRINLRSTIFGVLIALVVDIPLLVLTESSGMPMGRGTLIVSLVLMFFITWWIERRAVMRLVPAETHLRQNLAPLAANLLSYVLLCSAIAWSPFFGDLDRTEYRWQIGIVVLAGSDWRKAVEAYWIEHKRFPARAADLGLVAPTSEQRRLRGITLEAGGRIVLHLKFPDDAEIDGSRVILEPRVEGGVLKWRCGSPDPAYRFLPRSCRDDVGRTR